MVSKGKATKGSAEAIKYIQTEGEKKEIEALELDRNLIAGHKPHEILNEFREIQAERPSVKNNTFSIVLSPDRTQDNFTPELLREIGREHLKNLGLIDHQYLMTLHQDTDDLHIHMQVNRIDISGNQRTDSNIHWDCQNSAQKIAIERGWKTAKQREKEIKKETKIKRQNILKAYRKSRDQAKSYKEFLQLMNKQGLSVHLNRQKTGRIAGFRIAVGNANKDDRQNNFKASQIGKEVRIEKLAEQIKQNKELELQQQQKRQREQTRGKYFGPSL